MSLNTFFLVNAALAVVYGLGFLLIPTVLADLYDLALGDAGYYVGRLFGAALVFLAILFWQARTFGSGRATGSIVLAGLVGDGLALVVSIGAISAGLMNTLGWSVMGIYALLTIGFAYFQFTRQPASTPN